jgi:hypothetical protein
LARGAGGQWRLAGSVGRAAVEGGGGSGGVPGGWKRRK